MNQARSEYDTLIEKVSDRIQYAVYSSRFGRWLRCRECGVYLFGDHDGRCSRKRRLFKR